MKPVQLLAQSYYSRKDVQNAIYEFCKNRETVPNFNKEFYGKRPDALDYPSDLLNYAKKGATSFHCSEELWENPLSISTEMTQEQYNQIRTGWDFLIDIDSKYLDYSKIAARLIIKALEYHGVKNVGIKFSVSGDTPVLIKNKEKISLLSISEAIKIFKKTNDLKILSINRDKKLVFSDVYDSLEHKDTIYEIYHDQSKLPVKATKHHSVFIWAKGEIIEKKVEEIKKKDFLITFNSDTNPFSSNNQIIQNSFYLNKNQFSNNLVNKQVKPTKELMRLIGYFLAEGHVTNTINQTGFTFNRNETGYIADCKNLIKNLTNRYISIRHPNPNSTQILIHSKEWANFFDVYCGKKKDKHLPEFSWTLPKDLFLELLKGYIRGDGYKIGEYTIVAKSVSKKLITELVWLCKLNGISCSMSWEKNKSHRLPQGTLFKGSKAYMIKIPKSELSKEFNRKRNKFSPYPRDRTFPTDGLNYVYNQIKPKMFNNHRNEQMTLKKKRSNLHRIKKVLDWFSKFGSIKPDKISKKIISHYKQIFNSDVSVVQIKNILKKTNQKVYDVSVDESEAFFGNYYPVLLHNSGSKGFHLIIPWKAFPKEISGEQTKDKFPEWPRLIAGYIDEMVHDDLTREILKTNPKTAKTTTEAHCKKCDSLASKQSISIYKCANCRAEIKNMKAVKKTLRCPSCNFDMEKVSSPEIYTCNKCQLNSLKNPELFEERQTAKELIDTVDIILVASRHLFRCPYSLHEKTCLASIVIDKSEIKDFNPAMADPLKLEIKNFLPEPEPEEARELLLQALDWAKRKNKITTKKYEGKSINIKNLKINESMFPPCIQHLLKGQKQDGRKRALFILLTFLSSLELPQEYIQETLEKWNKKNYKPLEEGYIQGQKSWFEKNKILPPNCDKPQYKELQCPCTCQGIKNPINFTIKQAFRNKK